MCTEFLRSEVIEFLGYHSLFTLSLDDRTVFLYENGVIDEQSAALAKKQIFNDDLLDNYKISPLVRNKYLEKKIKEITGNDIKIIDHPDSEITGVSCASCGYIVFESQDDSVFEICPVCGWQSDKLSDTGYSKLNGDYLNTYTNTPLHIERVLLYKDIYIKK
ncbi:hypothetical protein KXR87_22860 [Yokenella regensburgei]|uniref:CPCC family cysteine-rich protein n=1 Tax=Yokenella regensburgei TaxID=158877 RepID=UPI003F17C67D